VKGHTGEARLAGVMLAFGCNPGGELTFRLAERLPCDVDCGRHQMRQRKSRQERQRAMGRAEA
jgi:hypothetical protein